MYKKVHRYFSNLFCVDATIKKLMKMPVNALNQQAVAEAHLQVSEKSQRECFAKILNN